MSVNWYGPHFPGHLSSGSFRNGLQAILSAAFLLALQWQSAPAFAFQPPAGGPLRLEVPEVSGRVDAALSPNFNQLLKPEYHLEIERHHSRLIITNKRVRRIAVSDVEVANYVQYSENEISILALSLGRTDLTLWFEDETTPTLYEITVIRDASLEEQRSIDFGKLERRIRILYPNSSVALIPIGAQVIVRGTAYDSEEAQNILQVVRTEVIRSLRSAAQNDQDMVGGLTGLGGVGLTGAGAGGGANGQNRGFRDIVINELVVPGEYNISLRVMVAEINRSELKNAGVDWRVLFGSGRNSVGSTLGAGSGTTLSGIFENGEISIFIKWLKSNGTIKLLAEPRLTVLSGTGASILAGGEFAVPTIIGLGGGQATSFRGFGTSLVVTPTVIDRDLIRMQVVPEFSQVTAENTVNGIPGTNVKRVQTTVELREGQTFAIGGLISNQTLTEVSHIPLLGDIPWLGPRVFQSKKASQIETELLVLVSPEIVRPYDADDVPPMPGFNVTMPTDEDLWCRGQTEGAPDHNVYQLAPYGSGSMRGIPQGYSLEAPAPMAGPQPAAAFGGYPGGYSGGFGNPQMGAAYGAWGQPGQPLMMDPGMSGMPAQPMMMPGEMMPGDPSGMSGGYMMPGMMPGAGGVPGMQMNVPVQPGMNGMPGGMGPGGMGPGQFGGQPPVPGSNLPQDLTVPEPGVDQQQNIPQDAPMPTPDSISTQTRRDRTVSPTVRPSGFAGLRGALQRNRETRPAAGTSVRPAGWNANR
ncbi:MAG: type II and III secretion system protein family protein [Planctomycetaceae bacterium]